MHFDILLRWFFPFVFMTFAEGDGAAGAGAGAGDAGGGDAAAAAAGGGDAGAGDGQGAGKGGDAGAGAGQASPKLPEGFTEERWAKLKDIDPDRYAKVKDVDPELYSKATGFYQKIAADQQLFQKVTELVDTHQKQFDNPAMKALSQELKTVKDFISDQQKLQAESEENQARDRFNADLVKTQDDVFKELKFEGVTDFDKSLIKGFVLAAFNEDHRSEQPKLTIADLKTLVTDSVKKIDTYRREVLKVMVKKDGSPDPIKDGSTADGKTGLDLKSKDSRVAAGQEYLQSQLQTT